MQRPPTRRATVLAALLLLGLAPLASAEDLPRLVPLSGAPSA